MKLHLPTPRKDEERTRALDATGRTACTRCGWEFIGPFREGIERAARHRTDEHPEIVIAKTFRPRGHDPWKARREAAAARRRALNEQVKRTELAAQLELPREALRRIGIFDGLRYDENTTLWSLVQDDAV
jgi:hypothetical protein